MPLANDLPSAGLALAACLGAIVIFLGLREWYERRARDAELSEADRDHFWRQDKRRGLGIGTLLLIAMLLPIGSRLSPDRDAAANLFFLILWILVLASVVVLLVLAVIDWQETRVYARRHRKRILRESIESLRRQARDAAGGPRPPDGANHTDLE